MKPSASGPQRRLHITCAVEDCHSPKTVGISYHRFPKDRNLNKQWRVLCRVRDVKEPRICSRHFLPTDFKRDLVNELLNRPTKKLLNSDAVPSLYLFKNQNAAPRLSKAQKAKKEEEEKIQRDALIERLLTKGPDPPPLPMEPKHKSIGIQVFECSSSEYQSQLAKLNAQKNRLQNIIEQQKVKINELRSSMRKIKSSKYVEPPQKSKKSQTEAVLRKKKVKKWSSEDIIYALRIRQMSAKTYSFIRRCDHFPLPGLSTLRNWIREFKVDKGFQEIAWSILKERLRTEKDPKFKLASIVYDEIECRNEYFDESHFPVIRKMQVVILRGLYNKWKYVIYQDLDSPVTKPVLDELILKAENIGIHVWAFSLNLDNKEIMEEVILKNSCFTFSNPFDRLRHIYIFPSMPSIIHDVRNIVFDLGVMLDSDSHTTLCKSDFEHLLKSTTVKDSSKFKSEHLDIQGNNRRCNRIAFQTFSSTVSKSMEVMGLPKEKVNMVQTLDAYIDVFNSRSKTFKNKIGSAFGINLDQQIVAIKEAENLAIKIRVMDSIAGKPELSMFPFQFAMIIGIQSLIELYNELVVRRGALDFILTSHLSTELVRSYCNKMGGHLGILEEFETEELFKRSRLVMIGKKNGKASSGFDEEVYLEAFEPLFGALPKKVVLDKKKKQGAIGKKKLLTRKRKGTTLSQEGEPEEKFKRMELPEIIQLPPEIYTF